jgi:hypothetical protein
MARKQTRRSISIKNESYDRVKAWCDVYKISMSSFIEERIADFFNGTPRTAEDVQKAEGDWLPSMPTPPSVPDRYPGTTIRKPTPPPVKSKPIRGGGVHEL